jgi:hypothetical protein
MEYLLPAYLVVAVAVGCALGFAQRIGRATVPRRAWLLPASVTAALAFMLLRAGAAARPALALQAATVQSAPYARAAIGCAPAGTVLASWHYYPPLEYARRHLVTRDDLRIQYVFPEGAEPIGATWLRHVGDLPDVAMLTDMPREVADAGPQVWPAAAGPFFTPRPARCAGLGDDNAPDVGVPVGTLFGDTVGLSGVEFTGQPDPSVTLWFLPVDAAAVPEEGLTAFVQLAGPDGRIFSQTDRHEAPDRWTNPDGLVMKLPLHQFRDQELPESLALRAGVYAPTAGGPVPLVPGAAAAGSATSGAATAATIFDLETASVWSEGTLPVAGGPDGPGVPFGEAMTLVGTTVQPRGGGGSDADDGSSDTGGGSSEGDGGSPDSDDTDLQVKGASPASLVVALDWLAERAFASDYRVSVQVWSPDGGWSAQHDGVPLMGAVPTLKWLPGMRLVDRHVVELPPGASPDDGYEVGVTVYDSFTGVPLPVTDRARVERGEGQRAVVFAQPPRGSN